MEIILLEKLPNLGALGDVVNVKSGNARNYLIPQGKALIANVAGNVMDYGGSVVGHELIITGNYSQAALKFRAGGRAETVANIPAAASF